MSTPNENRPQRVAVALRIRLKYHNQKEFIERFSHNLSPEGIFIKTREPASLGSRVQFEYFLSNDTRVFRGTGLVRWIRSVQESSDENPPGMGLEFVDLDAASEQLISLLTHTHKSSVEKKIEQNLEPQSYRSMVDICGSYILAMQQLMVTNAASEQSFSKLTHMPKIHTALGMRELPGFSAFLPTKRSAVKDTFLARQLAILLQESPIASETVVKSPKFMELLSESFKDMAEKSFQFSNGPYGLVIPLGGPHQTDLFDNILQTFVTAKFHTVLDEATAVRLGLKMNLNRDDRWLSLHLTPLEMRMAFMEPHHPVATMTSPWMGVMQADQRIYDALCDKLRRDMNIDFEQNWELQKELHQQVKILRKSKNPKKLYLQKNPPLEIKEDWLEEILISWHEQMVWHIEYLVETHRGARKDDRFGDVIIIQSDEALWPGLEKVLQRHLSTSIKIVSDPWIRLAGLLAKMSP